MWLNISDIAVYFAQMFSCEWIPGSKQFIQNSGNTEEIGRPVHGFSPQLLRRDVVFVLQSLCRDRRIQMLFPEQSEVQNLQRATRKNFDVRGIQGVMNNLLLVRIVEGGAELLRQRHDLRQPRILAGYVLPERGPLNELRCQKNRYLFEAAGIKPRDTRMIENIGGPRLFHHALDKFIYVVKPFRYLDLAQRHQSVDLWITRFVNSPDRAGQLLQQLNPVGAGSTICRGWRSS